MTADRLTKQLGIALEAMRAIADGEGTATVIAQQTLDEITRVGMEAIALEREEAPEPTEPAGVAADTGIIHVHAAPNTPEQAAAIQAVGEAAIKQLAARAAFPFGRAKADPAGVAGLADEPVGWLLKDPTGGHEFDSPMVEDAWREPLTDADREAGWRAIPLFVRTPPLLEVAKEALEPGADERGWLIETSFGPHIHYIGLCDPHDYWREQREKDRSTYGRSALVGIIRFCRDANDACRFARKQDAQQLVDALGQLLTDPQICEHEWPASPQAIKGAEQ